jgi:hypothetical protein
MLSNIAILHFVFHNDINMKRAKRSSSGLTLGLALLLGGIFFAGYEMIFKVALFEINYITSLFMVGIGLLFVSKAGKGKSAKELITKEDIGKYTLTGSFGMTLFFVFALFGLLLLFILLTKLGLI